jgi:hypothetical protein
MSVSEHDTVRRRRAARREQCVRRRRGPGADLGQMVLKHPRSMYVYEMRWPCASFEKNLYSPRFLSVLIPVSRSLSQ